MKTEYPIVIGGGNFGCGSSREHAPVAMGASGGAGMKRSRILQLRARATCRNGTAARLPVGI